MELTVEEFLHQAGLDEPLAPGQIKLRKHVGKNPSMSYTLAYDWKSDPDRIRIEVRPGLTGEMPDKKELSKYAIWLQSENYIDFELEAASTKQTRH